MPDNTRDERIVVIENNTYWKARAERLEEASRRVTAAFRALGEATAWTREAERARHECESAMLELDAAVDESMSRET